MKIEGRLLAGPAILALLAILGAGCQRSPEQEELVVPAEMEQEEFYRPVTYATGLTPASTPREIAELFLKGLATKDRELIAALVPAKREAEWQRKRFRKHGVHTRVTLGSAARLAASALLRGATIFDPTGAKISEGPVLGNTTAVRMLSKNIYTGNPMVLQLNLVREDGIWRVQKALTGQP